MLLHLPTLTLAVLAAFTLLVAQYLVSAQRWLPSRELLAWRQLAALLALIGLLVALRQHLPAAVLLGLFNLALGAGLLSLVLALLRFLHQDLHRGRLALAFAAYCVAVLACSSLLDEAHRAAGVSLAAALFLLPLAWTLQRHGWQAERALRTVVLAVWLLELVLLVRALHAGLMPQHFKANIALAWAPWELALPYGLGLLALLAIGFGYVMAVQERAQRRLRRQATQDQLTRLANRRLFETRLARALAQLPRSRDPLGVALLDIDNFKRINDQHGHATGDEALRHLAQVLKPRLRTADTLARWGGEEFVLLLPGTDSIGTARLLALLRETLHQRPMVLPESGMLVLTASVGWISLPGGSEAPSNELLMRSLDTALYAVKQAGKDGAREAALPPPALAPVSRPG